MSSTASRRSSSTTRTSRSRPLLLAIANGRIHRVFFHADLERLRYVGPRTTACPRA